MAATQTLIVSLESALVRRARSYVASHVNYETVSELVAVAIENQLALEEGMLGDSEEEEGAPVSAGQPPDGTFRSEVSEASSALLIKPEGARRVTLTGSRPMATLLSFTNRLFPVKVAARVLANTGEGESLASFQRLAAEAARGLGRRLREEDEAAGRSGWSRRWVALPVSQDPEAALNRYIHHFTLTVASDGQPHGPLAALGLAAIEDSGLVGPTDLGIELALTSNPVLDGVGDNGAVLSEEERHLFVSAIRRNASELAAVREFIELVEGHRGSQADIDASLGTRHEGWSKAQAVAHRASMVGRLRDLEMVEVESRGPAARIRLKEGAETFLEEG